MNTKQRQVLDGAFSSIEEIISKIEPIGEAEQEKFDNLGDKARENDKGQRMEEVAQAIEAAVTSLQEALASIENAKEE